jgi:glycerophosphoryl diester phosphodiesterase
MTPPILVPRPFRIIAHRGASAYAPENTLAAFDLALRIGASEIEVDTQLTWDGQVVLCHDKTLDRYGHGNCIVERMNWADLAGLDMGSWFSPFLFKGEKMITLDSLFRSYGDQLIYHIEIKGSAPLLPKAVYHIMVEYGLQDRCIVTSFSYDSLVTMRNFDPELRLGWLVDQIDPLVLTKADEIGLFQICPRADKVNAEAVAKAHAVAPEVRAWGLNGQPREVIKLIWNVIQAGCDGTTINWPDWLSYSS